MLPDGTTFVGPAGLKQALLTKPDQFVTTLTEKLLIYALGRGAEYYDAPTVRAIVRAGFDTFLAPTMTVGTGFFGRSAATENVGPQHLVQWVKVAYNRAQSVAFPAFDGLALPRPATRPRVPSGDIDYSFGWAGGTPSRGESEATRSGSADRNDLRDEIRRLILEELRAMQGGA